jgi:hypothetical protein
MSTVARGAISNRKRWLFVDAMQSQASQWRKSAAPGADATAAFRKSNPDSAGKLSPETRLQKAARSREMNGTEGAARVERFRWR